MIPLPYAVGTSANIFHNMTFNCDGQVSQWQFYTRSTGTVSLDVWRYINSTLMTLIGKNLVTVEVNNTIKVIYIYSE